MRVKSVQPPGNGRLTSASQTKPRRGFVILTIKDWKVRTSENQKPAVVLQTDKLLIL